MVWLVAWPSGGRREARVGVCGGDSELAFAALQADMPNPKQRLPHEHWHHQVCSGGEGRKVGHVATAAPVCAKLPASSRAPRAGPC